MPELSPKLLVTVGEVGRRLTLSTRSVWRLIQAGRLPVVRIGRCTRFDVRDLEAYVETNKSKGPRQ